MKLVKMRRYSNKKDINLKWMMTTYDDEISSSRVFYDRLNDFQRITLMLLMEDLGSKLQFILHAKRIFGA